MTEGRRILVIPERLGDLSAQFKRSAAELESMDHQLATKWAALDAQSRQVDVLAREVGACRARARAISQGAAEMSKFLQAKAQAFAQADGQLLSHGERGAGASLVSAIFQSFKKWILPLIKPTLPESILDLGSILKALPLPKTDLDNLPTPSYCGIGGDNPDVRGVRTYVVGGISNDNADDNKNDSHSYRIRDGLRNRGVQNVEVVDEAAFSEGTVRGVVQAIGEYTGIYTPRSNALAEYILEDLKRNPLKPGEGINIVGYSGGGILAENAANALKGKVPVDQIITVGTPIHKPVTNADEVNVGWSGSDPVQVGVQSILASNPVFAIPNLIGAVDPKTDHEYHPGVSHGEWSQDVDVLDWTAEQLLPAS